MAKKTKDLEKKLVGFSVIVLVIGVVAGYGAKSPNSSYAAPRPRGGSTGICYTSPNPTSQRSTFNVFLNGMPVNSLVNIYTQDSGGTGWSSVLTDSTGSAQYNDSYTAYSGTSKITVTSSSSRKQSTLATCTVTVQ